MAKSSRSRVPFFDAHSRRPVDALNQATVHRSSAGLRWTGVHVEIASHEGWVVDDVQVDGYYVAINLDREPLAIEHAACGGFRRALVAPAGLVVHPHGEPFSLRVAQGARWGGVLLAPAFVESTLGRGFDMSASFGADDPQTRSIVDALVQETRQGGPSGSLFAEHLGAALAMRLAVRQRQGADPATTRRGGGIAPGRLRRVVEHVHAHLDRNLSLEELARIAGLSRFHFAREFKRATGRAPHQFVLDRRLDRARDLLRHTILPVADIALRCGFADPSHLVRAFRLRFGATPGRWRSGAD